MNFIMELIDRIDNLENIIKNNILQINKFESNIS